MTLREAQIVIEAAHLRDARLAWQAAQFHRFAVHQPNDMPPEPGTAPRIDPAVKAEMERIDRDVKLKADMERARNGS